MRESIGGAYLLYIAIFFIGAVMIIFVSVFSYNRSFKVKNRIIEIIESHGEFDASNANNSAEKEIMDYLGEVGYWVKPGYNCPDVGGVSAVAKHSSDTYEYCIYKYTSNSKTYYKVITYSYFNFPIIDSTFRFTISGETKLLG